MSSVKLHQLMVLALVRKFNEDGLKLKAATYFRDLEIPNPIGRHRPDVLAEGSDGTLHIGEAKLEPDLSTKKTYEQFTDFLNTKSPNGNMAKLHIIVESATEDKLREILEEWKLPLDNIIIWTY